MIQGDIVSYLEMCKEEGASLQRGMNFRLKGGRSVLLMNVGPDARYVDEVRENGRVLIYEGHDVPRQSTKPDPKTVDQVATLPSGTLTQNGLFFEAARSHRHGECKPELVRVYEKIRPGIWAFNGLFKLIDAWQEDSNGRKVFKFKLQLVEEGPLPTTGEAREIEHTRIIPTEVKLEVWKRDKGKCVVCGRPDNLHFDHIIPYSKGGSSLVSENIRLLCMRHNLAKRDRIE